jgi:uncharacterized membrane protein YdbT with pleckstrin-like domain
MTGLSGAIVLVVALAILVAIWLVWTAANVARWRRGRRTPGARELEEP